MARSEVGKLDDTVSSLKNEIDLLRKAAEREVEEVRERYEERLAQEQSRKAAGNVETDQLRERIKRLEDTLREREQQPLRMVAALEAQHVEAADQLENL